MHCGKKWEWPILSKKVSEPWLVWLGGLSMGLPTERLPVQFQVRAHAWVVGQAPSWGHVRSNHLMFLSVSFSLPAPLSKNKINKIFFFFFKKVSESLQDPSELVSGKGLLAQVVSHCADQLLTRSLLHAQLP